MQEILGENFNPQDTPTTDSIPELVWSDSEEPEAPPQEPKVLTEETIKQLVPLLEEVRDLLREMTAATTSSGNIGVSMAGSQKDSESWAKMEKKYGYLTAKPAKTRKQVLQQSIKSKLRKK